MSPTHFLTCATFLLCTSTIVNAKTVRGWEVAKSASAACLIQGAFEGDELISVFYDMRTDESGLSITSWRFKSLMENDLVPIRIIFGTDHSYAGTGKTSIWPDGRRNIILLFDGMEFLASFSISPSVELKTNNVFIGQYSLNGSRLAVRDLINCAANSAKNSKEDPFSAHR